MQALYNAFKGNFKNGFAFCGSNTYKANKITSVKNTISELMKGWKDAEFFSKK